VQLLKERAKPFDNFRIDMELSGRHIIPPSLYDRDMERGYTYNPRPEVEIKYEARKTLMVRDTQVTFEREYTSQKSTMEPFSFSEKTKWSNTTGHIRELTTTRGKSDMSISPLERFAPGTWYSDKILLAMGVGIGRFIESIESIQNEPNGDLTVKGNIFLDGSGGPCTMRLNKDYFPLHISLMVVLRQETYEITIDEVAKVDGHWYGKTGKLVHNGEIKMIGRSLHQVVIADYAYKVSEIKLSVSDEEFEQFSSMPIAATGMHVQNRLPEPKTQNPLPDLP
jgi:hypothetical protein